MVDRIGIVGIRKSKMIIAAIIVIAIVVVILFVLFWVIPNLPFG
jgi:hypothetical protein